MDNFYDKLINSNEHLKNVLDIFVSMKNTKEYVYSTDEKRELIKKITDLGFSTNIVGDSVIFAYKESDKKISFEKSIVNYNSLKITTEQNGNIFIFIYSMNIKASNNNYYHDKNYKIELINEKHHLDFWIYKNSVESSLVTNKNCNSGNEKKKILKEVFDFVIENFSKETEELIDLIRLNFDVDLKDYKALQIIVPELIRFQEDIKEINVMKKNTIGLKING